MPELPEVQTVVDEIRAADIAGRIITRVDVFWPKTISGMAPEAFSATLLDRTVEAVWRRGKYIVIDLSDTGTLLIHLRMSGRLYLSDSATPRDRHEHLLIGLNNGKDLRLHDTRKFGRAMVTEISGDILNRLGLEPLASNFTTRALKSAVKHRQRMLKPLLLDQSVIAGLGNIYVDESLWHARLHPCRPASSLADPEIKSLRTGIVKILKQAVRNRGTSLGSGQTNFKSFERKTGEHKKFLKVYGRTGQPCPRCRTPIERQLVGQRGTHLCPMCQPLA